MSRIRVFDIEADGLNPTLIHCMSINMEGEIVTTFNYDKMRMFVQNDMNVAIAHNGVRFDAPALSRILGVKIRCKVICTLGLSWYLYPTRLRHGLGDWGEEFGIPKPPIDDWEGLTKEEYKHRCEEDVKINTMLWDKIWKDLMKLYSNDEEAVWRLINYINFKMECAAEQERSRWKLDIPRCQKVLDICLNDQAEKVIELKKWMPPVPIYAKKSRPAKPFLQSGKLSVTGERWQEFCDEQGIDFDSEEEHRYDTGRTNEPNPNSGVQLKDWLFSMGWKPCTFEYKRNKLTGEVRKIPQVNLPNGGGLTPSIKELFPQCKGLHVLDGLSILTHRIGILKGFLRNVDAEGFVQAQIQGFTNTLRFKHKVCVNLPAPDKPYGEEIRGCLTVEEGYELCGSDMCSLEDRTKQHYMYPYDPDYVDEMNTPDFDPHIDMCIQGNMMTVEEGQQYKDADEGFKTTRIYKALHKLRKQGKQTNYSCVYGAGAESVARGAKISLAGGKKLVETYWKRNWSVKAIAKDQRTKKCHGLSWLWNPVAKLWYYLKYDKDRFSTLNQGTGTYCFDAWVKKFRSKRGQLTGQFHDEVILTVKTGHRDAVIQLLKWAIQEVNKDLKLNRELDVDVEFGTRYSDIH